MAGFGVGINAQSNKQRGPIAHDPRVMFREAVDLILKAWEAPEPFDWNGTVWQGEKWHIIPKPMTELEVGIACSRSDTTVELTAEKGLLPLMSWTPTVRADARHARHLSAARRTSAGRRRRAAACGSAAWSMSATRWREAKRDLRDADLAHAHMPHAAS